MGLDAFSSGGSDDDDEENTSDETSSTTQSSTREAGESQVETDQVDGTEMDFYGTDNPNPGTRPMERKGAMSGLDFGDLKEIAEDEIQIERDSVKYHLPLFMVITEDDEYTEGARYQLKHQKDTPRASWNKKVVVCTHTHQTVLGKVTKEMAMLCAGTTSKQRAIEYINTKLNTKADSDTSIYVSYMLDSMFARDMAQASEEFKEGELVNRDDITGRVIKPKMLRLALER